MVQQYLMTDNRDWEWVDRYSARMGDKALVEYSRRLYNYLHALPSGAELLISNLAERKNIELFTKCICRFQYEGSLHIQFSSDYTRIRKF